MSHQGDQTSTNPKMDLHELKIGHLLSDWRTAGVLIIGFILGFLFLMQLIPGWDLPGQLTPWAKTPMDRAEAAGAFYCIAAIGVAVGISALLSLGKATDSK